MKFEKYSILIYTDLNSKLRRSIESMDAYDYEIYNII